jgi:hypothetical protein
MITGQEAKQKIISQGRRKYGPQNIVNETLSHAIPASIRTGETYFQNKERLVILSFHHSNFQWYIPGMNSNASYAMLHQDFHPKTLGLALNTTTKVS